MPQRIIRALKYFATIHHFNTFFPTVKCFLNKMRDYFWNFKKISSLEGRVLTMQVCKKDGCPLQGGVGIVIVMAGIL